MRTGLRAGFGAVVVLFSVCAVGGYACIPEPDTSGLPARDASVADTSVIQPAVDAGKDGAIGADSGDAGSPETGGQTGMIVGAVINYSEGAGRGVLPGAIVSVAGSSPLISATTDAQGVFVLPAVPAGKAVINVSHPTDKTRHIAYGTTQQVVTVTAGGTLSLFPVVHTGCFTTFNIATDTTSGMIRRLQDGCFQRSGAFASFYIADPTSLQLPGGALYTGSARVELIPIAFPMGEGPDLSWSIGMPGDLTAQGGALDPVGGAEIRVVVSTTDPNATPKDGTPLELVNGHKATLEIPVYRAPASSDGGNEQLTPWTYDTTQSKWVPDTTSTGATFSGPDGGSTQAFTVLSLSVAHLSWWSVGKLRAQSGCVAGTLRAGGVPAANVVVRGVGLNYFGASAAITGADGKFCLDGVAAPPQAVSQLTLVAGYKPSAGSAFTLHSDAEPLSAAGTSCAIDSTKCSQIGPLDMNVLAGSCASGRITFDVPDGGPVTAPLDVHLEVGVSNNQLTAGISSQPYVGQITPSTNGVACIPANPGDGLTLTNDTICGQGNGTGNAPLSIPADLDAGTCGGPSCADAGGIFFACPVL